MVRKCIFIIFLTLSSGAYATEKITVLLDWFQNPSHAPLFVAEYKGFFEEENLKVKLISPSDPTDPPKLVAAGKADIAITYEPQFMEQVDQGLPLVSIGSLINHPLNCIAVLKNGPIHSIKDLKGKRIGSSIGSIDTSLLKTMLDKNGIKITDVESITVHYDLSQALLSKKVDAVTGMMRTFEIIQMELQKNPVLTFYPEENGVPPYDELIFIVNKSHINDTRFKRFLNAIKKGEAYLRSHPDEMWYAFANAHPELNNTLNQHAWVATLPYFSHNPAVIDKKQWQNFAIYMQKNGLIQHVQAYTQ